MKENHARNSSTIAIVTASATLLQAANGLLQALLPLRMSSNGVSVIGIGAVGTAYGVGFVIGCLFAPGLVRRIGHTGTFVTLAAITAAAVLSFTQATSVAAWVGLRAISGLALAILLTVVDSWISQVAVLGKRGQTLSAYMLCTKLALMLSPLCIWLGDIENNGLFMLVAAVLCLSPVPLARTRSEEPALPHVLSPDIGLLLTIAPAAVVGCLLVGLMNGAVLALAPVYGLEMGLAPDLSGVLLAALQGGSLLCQWPLGWLSDRIDRGIVIAALAGGTALLSGLLAYTNIFSGSPAFILVGLALWGGLAFSMYAICLAHASDSVQPSAIVQTISTLLISWATGMLIGPILAAALMEQIGARGLFVYTGSAALLSGTFICTRSLFRGR